MFVSENQNKYVMKMPHMYTSQNLNSIMGLNIFGIFCKYHDQTINKHLFLNTVQWKEAAINFKLIDLCQL